MKSKLLFALIIIIGAVFAGSASAGTLRAGVQGKYILWDSGLAKINAEALEKQIKNELDQGYASNAEFLDYGSFKVGDPESKGFVLGPEISYETDDKRWEFDAEVMLIGSYTTDVTSSVDVYGTFPIVGTVTMPLDINTSLDIDYRELDFRAGRMITDNFGIFAGYIFQSYKSELEADYNFTFASSSMNSSLSFKLDALMHMLYAGISYKKPFYQIFTFKGNLGFGTPVAGKVEQDIKISGTYFSKDITNDGGEVKYAYLVFGELEIAAEVVENVNLELGYQCRCLNTKVEKLDLEGDGSANDKADETDIFHGITFAATYSFNI